MEWRKKRGRDEDRFAYSLLPSIFGIKQIFDDGTIVVIKKFIVADDPLLSIILRKKWRVFEQNGDRL